MSRLVRGLVGVGLLTVGLLGALYWFAFRVYVPEGKCLVLIHKTGDTLPQGQKVATTTGQRGIQRDALGPGRYFFNPFFWSHELHDLVTVSAGDPSSWEWVHSLDEAQREQIRAGKFAFKGKFPKVGVVTRLVGEKRADGCPIVTRESGHQGILEDVLTPGDYRLNPYVYEVTQHPAAVIPAGFVGVVTNRFDQAVIDGSAALGDKDEDASSAVKGGRDLAQPGERGTLADVLQPGVYFINPRLRKVTLIEIGFNEYSQIKVSDLENNRIAFPSDTGYEIRVGVTVIWGIDPANAARIINEFGNVDRVLETVIGSQLPSICRNIGSTYDARDFIHGEKREMFQSDLTKKLQQVCKTKNVEVLLALVREIEVHAPGADGSAGEMTEDLKQTIQESYIAIEKQLTKQKQTDAAVVRAELEEARKRVDIARETIQADSRVMVANILAEAEKEAAQIDAQAKLEVAGIQEQIATLDAQRIRILGQARTDVDKFRNQAEAEGYALLVDAMGGGQAFNLYTFAENFEPKSIRLVFAGEGTLWTDLTRFEEIGAAHLLQADSPSD